MWESTTLLVTSDHWWRKDFWSKSHFWTQEESALVGESDHRIPFLLKMGGQREGMPARPAPPAGQVFLINFMRRQTLPLRVRRTLIYIALSYLAASVVLSIGLISVAVHDHAESRSLQRTLKGRLPPVEALNALKTDMDTLHQQATKNHLHIEELLELQRERLPVAGKLAVLAKTLPARTWITSLAGDRDDRTLSISATYLIDPDRPYMLPIKPWIEALERNPNFGQGLQRLELTTSSRTVVGKAELVAFELIAEWAPRTGGPAHAAP